MKKINALRYAGSKNVTLIADKKNNPELPAPMQVTLPVDSDLNPEDLLRTRIAEQISEEDLPYTAEDIELEVKDAPKFTKYTTEQLLKYYDKTEEMLGAHEQIEEILIKRGALTINEEESEEPVEGEAEETKAPREYKKCMTEECLQARLAQARKNYKKFVKFLCTKTKTEEFGIIRSARLDKRSGFIQYRIEIIAKPTEDSAIYTERSGRIFGKGDDSKDLTIFEEKPAEIQLSESKKSEEETAQEA